MIIYISIKPIIILFCQLPAGKRGERMCHQYLTIYFMYVHVGLLYSHMFYKDVEANPAILPPPAKNADMTSNVNVPADRVLHCLI